jgi:hypothetical protein
MGAQRGLRETVSAPLEIKKNTFGRGSKGRSLVGVNADPYGRGRRGDQKGSGN